MSDLPPLPPGFKIDIVPQQPPLPQGFNPVPDVQPVPPSPAQPDSFGRTVNDWMGFFTGEGAAKKRYPEFKEFVATLPQRGGAVSKIGQKGPTQEEFHGMAMMEPDERLRANYVAKKFPGSTVRQEGRETIITIPGKGEFSMNRVGPSGQDIEETVYAAPHMIAGGAGALIGKSALRRALGVGATTAADTAVSQAASMAGGTGRKISLPDIVVSGATASLLGGLGEQGYRALRGLFARKALVNVNGQITPQAQLILTKAGVDPDRITMETLRELEPLMARAATPEEALRLAQARSLDVPVTRGDITRDPKTQAFEARVQKGGTYGTVTMPAERRLQALKAEEQPAALREAMSKTSEKVSGRPTDFDPETGQLATPTGANFDRTQKTLAALRERDRATVKRLYERGFADEASFMPDKLSSLAREFQKIKEGTNQSGAIAIADDLSKIIKDSMAGGRVPVKLETVEIKVRQKISELAGSSDARDRAMAAKLRQAYRDWESGLKDTDFVKGSPDAIAAIMSGRKKRAEMAAKFDDDPAIKAILKSERMADGKYKLDLNPSEAADTILGAGMGKRGAADSAKRIKSVLGENSDAWKAFKQEMYAKIAEKGPTNLYQSFQRFVRDNPELARVIFSKDDLAQISTMADVARFTTFRPTGVVNNSGSAYEIARMMPLTNIGNAMIGKAITSTQPAASLRPLIPPAPPSALFGAASYTGQKDPLALAERLKLAPQ